MYFQSYIIQNGQIKLIHDTEYFHVIKILFRKK